MAKLDVLKKITREVAPSLFQAAASFVPGGPLAAMAISRIGQAVLGKPDAKPEEIDAALQANTDPKVLLELKQADQKFQTDMAGIGVDLEKLRVEDVESARSMHIATSQELTPKILAYSMVAFFMIYSFGAMWIVLHYGSRVTEAILTPLIGIVNYVLGYATGEIKTIYQFFFGSSSGSEAKTTVLADALHDATK